jgi:hypothetical protein
MVEELLQFLDEGAFVSDVTFLVVLDVHSKHHVKRETVLGAVKKVSARLRLEKTF